MRTKNPSYREEPNPTDVMVEAQETRGDEPEETESNPPSNPQDSTEPEEEIEAMQPLNMYFGPEEYTKPFKISAKCYIAQTVRLLGTLLKPFELDWFLLHPQFKHFFHMPKNSNHKLMGMWMLLLRTACLEKKKECWFIVNGVPIRYSLREMALMSGLNCRKYPPFMEGLGSLEFAGKYFGVGATVTYAKVKAKLLSMKEPGTDRLKMAVLFFLSSIIIGKKKGGKQAASVEPFFLRVVDDLEECKTFPWGRLAFDENMKDIFHLMNHFDGVVGAPWVFPSFVIPLEFLAFEAIHVLKNTFREDVSNVRAYRKCPRMCRMKFKPSKMKGFSLTEIYNCLGTTKEIHSKMEKERVEKERAEKERVEKERAEKEKAEKERVEAEKERAEKELAEKEKAEKEGVETEKERVEKERAEKELAEKEKAEKERVEAEKERVEKERAEKERVEKERAEKEKAEKERVEKEKAEKEKAEKEMAEKEKAEAEKAVAEKVEAEKVEGKKEKAVNDQEEKVDGERQISIQYEKKSRKRNAEVQGEEEVAGEAQQNKKMKIIGKKGKKGSTVVIRSPIMTRQKKEQKKD